MSYFANVEFCKGSKTLGACSTKLNLVKCICLPIYQSTNGVKTILSAIEKMMSKGKKNNQNSPILNR